MLLGEPCILTLVPRAIHTSWATCKGSGEKAKHIFLKLNLQLNNKRRDNRKLRFVIKKGRLCYLWI